MEPRGPSITQKGHTIPRISAKQARIVVVSESTNKGSKFTPGVNNEDPHGFVSHIRVSTYNRTFRPEAGRPNDRRFAQKPASQFNCLLVFLNDFWRNAHLNIIVLDTNIKGVHFQATIITPGPIADIKTPCVQRA